jgi:hypothetical protein
MEEEDIRRFINHAVKDDNAAVRTPYPSLILIRRDQCLDQHILSSIYDLFKNFLCMHVLKYAMILHFLDKFSIFSDIPIF